MIKIHEIVEEILLDDEEGLYALSEGYMNLSKYAKKIHKQVEQRSKKDVELTGIVVALSRLKKGIKRAHPIIQNVRIMNITTRAPLTQIVYEKHSPILSKLSSFYASIKTNADDFLTMTLSSSEVVVICSNRLRPLVEKHFHEKPHEVETGLASLGLSIDPAQYTMPNITFSLLKRIARKRINLEETITMHTEITFIFKERFLGEILPLFSVSM